MERCKECSRLLFPPALPAPTRVYCSAACRNRAKTKRLLARRADGDPAAQRRAPTGNRDPVKKAEVIRLLNEGYTMAAIGRYVRLSAKTIRAIADQIGWEAYGPMVDTSLIRRPQTRRRRAKGPDTATKHRVVELIHQGYSMTAVRQHLRLSPKTVREIVHSVYRTG